MSRKNVFDDAENVRKAGREFADTLLKSPAGKVFERIVIKCLDALSNLLKNHR